MYGGAVYRYMQTLRGVGRVIQCVRARYIKIIINTI